MSRSRRELLKNIGVGLTLSAGGANLVSAQAAQHVHQAVNQEKSSAGGVYKPKCFNDHEYRTLRRLAELIIPADGQSKGALEAGAPEFIDLLASNNEELARIYTGGLAWIDRQIEKRFQATFVDAKPEQQSALLDLIAYRRNQSSELGPGIRFFAWVRNMVVDAYFTSKAGMDALGYMGNGAMSKFTVPVEAIGYAVKRSGL